MSIKNLSQLKGRVYVYLATEEIKEEFLRDAIAEGLTHGDGIPLTERPLSNIMAVNPNHTLNYVGLIGHIAYGSGTSTVGNQPLIRVDYEKYKGSLQHNNP